MRNIQTLAINLQAGSRVKIINSLVEELGTHIIYHLEDLNDYSYLKSFENVLISKENKDKFRKRNTYTNGFVKALSGELIIKNSTVRDSMSHNGMIVINDK